jgi:hypothetical protein
MEAQHVKARRRDCSHQAGDEVARFEEESAGAIGPGLLEHKPDRMRTRPSFASCAIGGIRSVTKSSQSSRVKAPVSCASSIPSRTNAWWSRCGCSTLGAIACGSRPRRAPRSKRSWI